MGWLDFIASLAGSLAWPAVVATAVVVLRRELRGAVRALERLKYKNFEAEFSRKTAELEQKATALEGRTPADISFPTPRSADELLEDLLRTSPRVAVVEAFALVERAVREAAERHGLSLENRRGVREALGGLDRLGLVPGDVKGLFHDLRTVRNELAHARQAEITEQDAWRYVNVARMLAAHFSKS